jgi:quinolinate synthase
MAVQTACSESQESRILPLLHPVARTQYAHGGRADQIPLLYAQMEGEELDRRIRRAKAALGERLLILGHHYQRDEIIQYADLRGDSFKLAQLAAARPQADYIVFCGVHFMAESADILSAPHQKVILPNPTAGCSLADMASIAEVEECWEVLNEVLGAEAGLLPITYINSAANLKAFCGQHGGLVCTSSNALKVMQWAFQRGKRLLFFPDEHLGRNTGHAYGVPAEEMVVWDPRNPQEALDDEQRLRRARLILWKGYCSTHMRFTVQQILKARAEHPGIKVIVHPECRREVVEAADLYGSTEYIIRQIEQAPPGSQWAVGTEINLVHRLAQEHPDKLIFCLDPIVCPCSTMYRIHPAYLAWVLEELVEGRVINQVSVPAEVAHWARVALDRMLALQ